MTRLPVTLLASLALLASCSAEQEPPQSAAPAQPAMVVEMTPVTEPAADPFEHFDTDTSILTVMNAMVQPNVIELWQAVRYVVTEDGVEEDVQPETEEDWARLQASAVSLIEAGNAMLVPGRTVAATPDDYPDYLYRSDEIRDMIDADQEGWRFYVEQMQLTTRATLEAIERRDILGLIETGGAINNACDGCHATFWYRR